MRTVPKVLFKNNAHRKAEIAYKNYQVFEDLKQVKIQLTHHVLVFLEQGEKVIHTAQNSMILKAPAIFIIKRGNYLMGERLLQNDALYKSSLLFFSDTQVEQFISKYQLTKQPIHGVRRVFELSNNPLYQDWLGQYRHMIQHQTPTFEVMELRLEELFLHFLQAENIRLFFELVGQSAKVDFLALIDSKITESIHLDELAFLSNMSLSTFKRKFKAEFGISAGQFIRKRKLHIAKEKISTGRAKGSDIYYELGYQNHSNFITAFKREFGVSPEAYTPSQYRVQN